MGNKRFSSFVFLFCMVIVLSCVASPASAHFLEGAWISDSYTHYGHKFTTNIQLAGDRGRIESFSSTGGNVVDPLSNVVYGSSSFSYTIGSNTKDVYTASYSRIDSNTADIELAGIPEKVRFKRRAGVPEGGYTDDEVNAIESAAGCNTGVGALGLLAAAVMLGRKKR